MSAFRLSRQLIECDYEHLESLDSGNAAHDVLLREIQGLDVSRDISDNDL
jgi:hypothetical protein